MSTPTPSAAQVVQAGLALLELGKAVSDGNLTNAEDAARALQAIAVQLAPVADLKQWLDEADRARIDKFGELAAEAILGPRPGPDPVEPAK